MYIQPQSIFKMLKGVPFNSNKKHTIWFRSAQEQYTYFNSKSVKTFTDFTYIKQNGVVRVPAVADAIYDCNYCMFKNVGFGDKWFYGYITDIEYVNNEVSHVSIEIDYLQTWLFDISIGKCFVEREHVADDSIGLHTYPEPIDYGDSVTCEIKNYYFRDWVVVIQIVPNSIASLIQQVIGQPNGDIIQNQYTGCKLEIVELDASELNTKINTLITTGYTILNMYMAPRDFTDDDKHNDAIRGSKLPSRPNSYYDYTNPNVYVPKNNKLFVYPYTFLRVSNNQGMLQDYKWELWNATGTGVAFIFNSTYVNGCCCEITPEGYNTRWPENRLNSIPLNEFPTISWNENSFILGIRQTLENLASSLVNSTTINYTGSKAIQGNVKLPTFKVISGYEEMQLSNSSFGSDVVQGNTSRPNLDLAKGRHLDDTYIGYTFYSMGIRSEYAKIVDDFFTRFGYAVNCYKIPELTSRSSFNYVKTADCNITGNAPNEALENISTLFNTGITLWHNTNVRNYDTDNSIVEGGE